MCYCCLELFIFHIIIGPVMLLFCFTVGSVVHVLTVCKCLYKSVHPVFIDVTTGLLSALIKTLQSLRFRTVILCGPPQHLHALCCTSYIRHLLVSIKNNMNFM